jgi:hypothetical protein
MNSILALQAMAPAAARSHTGRDLSSLASVNCCNKPN